MPDDIKSITAQRNWLANRLSYMMNGPLRGTPGDIMVGWSTGPIVHPNPEQVLLMAKEMVEHGDNGFTYNNLPRLKPLPTAIGR